MAQGKNSDVKVIRVVKKKGHGGHHGGSWKVAYADFVTAMMAFFLVMWIISLDQGTRQVIQGYFNNPIGFQNGTAAGGTPLAGGTPPANLTMQQMARMAREYQRRRFEEVGDRIRDKLGSVPGLKDLEAQVEIVVTDDGLRIELQETGEGETFFAFSSAELRPAARKVLYIIAKELDTLANGVVIEGHTDAVPYVRPGYSNWELSVDRANAARRALVAGGLPLARITEVRGYADRDLRFPTRPRDPANRRVTILLPFADVGAAGALSYPAGDQAGN